MRNRLIKIFIYSSIAFILLDGFWLINRIGLRRESIRGIIISAISGILFAAVLTTFFYVYIRMVRSKYGEKSLNIIQNAEMLLPGNINEIFLRSLSLLEKANKFKTVKPFMENNKIEVQTGVSWQSFGEDIEIIFSSQEEKVKVGVTSKPRYKTTLVDYGKNYENVKFILSLLEQTS